MAVSAAACGAGAPGKRKCAALLFLAAALLGMAAPSSAAVHTVGDTTGWTILGNYNYSAWAASKTFRVGDTIVFNYNKQFHNVMEVSMSDYDSCSSAAPISTHTSGMDSITLKSAGHHYFLCGVPGHCAIGQKVDINVLGSGGAAPAASPAASAAPSPAPTSAAVYAVGDATGWTILGNYNYSAWAASKTFHVGDTIVFNYNKQFHNVMEVKEADYASCSTAAPIATHTSGRDSITLKAAGHHYFLCGVPGHCAIGQKVDVNVLASGSASPAAGSPASPTPTSAPATGGSGGGFGAAPGPGRSGAAPVAVASSYLMGCALALAAVAASSVCL